MGLLQCIAGYQQRFGVLVKSVQSATSLKQKINAETQQ